MTNKILIDGDYGILSLDDNGEIKVVEQHHEMTKREIATMLLKLRRVCAGNKFCDKCPVAEILQIDDSDYISYECPCYRLLKYEDYDIEDEC